MSDTKRGNSYRSILRREAEWNVLRQERTDSVIPRFPRSIAEYHAKTNIASQGKPRNAPTITAAARATAVARVTTFLALVIYLSLGRKCFFGIFFAAR